MAVSPRSLGRICIVLMGLAFLPLVAKAIGKPYLPSADWLASIELFAIAFSVFTALFFFWVAQTRRPMHENANSKGAIIIWMTLPLGYVIGKMAFLAGIPMVLALLFGHQVERAFTVEDANRIGGRRCKFPVTVADVPFPFRTLCFSSFGGQLHFQSGDAFLVTGRGTSLGVFVGSLRSGKEPASAK